MAQTTVGTLKSADGRVRMHLGPDGCECFDIERPAGTPMAECIGERELRRTHPEVLPLLNDFRQAEANGF